MKAHTVELYLDSAREYRWRRKAANGRIVADCSEGYESMAACVTDLISVNGRPWTLVNNLGDFTGGTDTPPELEPGQ